MHTAETVRTAPTPDQARQICEMIDKAIFDNKGFCIALDVKGFSLIITDPKNDLGDAFDVQVSVFLKGNAIDLSGFKMAVTGYSGAEMVVKNSTELREGKILIHDVPSDLERFQVRTFPPTLEVVEARA